MAAVDHDARCDTLTLQRLTRGRHAGGIVVRRAVATAQHQMGVGVARGMQQGRMAEVIDAEVLMRVRRRAHGVAGDADTAVGAVLEAHRQVQAADHLAVHLRFAGTRTDGGPTEQVVEVTGGHRLQQFGGQRQTALKDIQHQLSRQAQAFGHVTAAIEVRVVQQPFPANRGARFFHVGAHHQQQLVIDLCRQLGQAFGVFEGAGAVMQGAGADHHQQARITAIEHGTDGVAVGGDTFGKGVGQRQALAQYGGAGQRLGAAAGDGGNGRSELSGAVHDLAVPWPARSIPRRR